MAADLASPRSPLLLPSPRLAAQQPLSARQQASARTPAVGSAQQRQISGGSMPPSPFNHHLMSPRHTDTAAKAYGRLMSWRHLTPGPRLSGFIHLPTDTSGDGGAGSSPSKEAKGATQQAAAAAAGGQQQPADGAAGAAAEPAVAGTANAPAVAAPAGENGAAAAGAEAEDGRAAADVEQPATAEQPAIAALLPVGRPPEPGSGQERPSWAKLPDKSERLALQEAVLWEPPDAATVSRRFPPTIYLPLPPPSGRIEAMRNWLHERTGFTAEHTALALQLAVAVAGASALHVTRESYEALEKRTVWIVVTGGWD